MKTTVANKRVGEIELWRAIFCLIIMIRHASDLFGTTDGLPFAGGSLCVEFFFIVSGYLMMASVDKMGPLSPGTLGRDTISFVGKKIGSFYPEMLTAYIVGFAFESVAQGLHLREMLKLFMRDPFEIVLLGMAGFSKNAINGATWYLQSMILCMLLLYPLVRKFPDIMKNVVCPLAAVLLLGWLCRNYGNPRDPLFWVGFTYKGNVRAVAELSMGIVAYPVVQRLRTIRLNLLERGILTAVKWGCIFALLAYLWTLIAKYDYLFCFVIWVVVVLMFSQQCVDTGLYQNRFVIWLGKMSLPYYLSHMFYAQNLPYILPKDLSRGQMWAVYFGCTIVTTAVVYWAGKGIRKLAGGVKNQFMAMKTAE